MRWARLRVSFFFGDVSGCSFEVVYIQKQKGMGRAYIGVGAVDLGLAGLDGVVAVGDTVVVFGSARHFVGGFVVVVEKGRERWFGLVAGVGIGSAWLLL